MKRVIVKSVHGAFGYVMEHYYPFGMEQEATEQGALTDDVLESAWIRKQIGLM